MRAPGFPGPVGPLILSVVAVTATPIAAGRTAAPAESSAPAFRVTHLPAPVGASWAIPWALNGQGRVVGNTQTSGVIWNGGGATEIPLQAGMVELTARGLNRDGGVVGTATDDAGTTSAFYFDGGTVVDLFPQRAEGESSQAAGINDAGLIAGTAMLLESGGGVPVEHAIVWQPGSAAATVIELPPVGGGSTAIAVNNAGQVLGQCGSTAFIWQDGVINNLGELNMVMLGFNDGGSIAGFTINDEGDRWVAVVYDGAGFDELDALGGFDAQAWGLNNAGDVVGSAQVPSGEWHAALWTPDGAIDLHELVAAQIDGTLTLARGINDAGQIIAQSSGGAAFVDAWLLTPAALGDLDGDGLVGITDVLQLLAAWGPCACAADLDHDGAVGINDLLLLLGNWG